MSFQCEPESESLDAPVLFAMPVGPPFGGMTAYTAMLRASSLFKQGMAHLLDTTPVADGKKGVPRVAQSLRRTLTVIRDVRKAQVGLVQFMTSDYLGFFEKGIMATAAQAAGARAVLHLVGGFVEFYAMAGWKRPIIRWILARMDAIIAVHPDVATYISRIAPGADVWVIPNPVVCSATPPMVSRPACGPLKVLFTGGLKRAKGVLDLLELARRIRDRGVPIRFVVVGEGPEAEACHEFVRQHQLEDVVELPGFVDAETKTELLSTCDIYCLPTYSEGTPISVLEAMAAGMPIVSTTVGGVPFAVTHGKQGWLVPPGDMSGMERALLHLLAAPHVRAAMGRNGWQRTHELFALDVVVPTLLCQLNRLAGRPGRFSPTSR